MERVWKEVRHGFAPLLAGVALVAAGAAAARYSRDPGARAETLLLAIWSAATLVPLGWAAARAAYPRRARLAPAGGALAAGAALALLSRDGATRPAVVAAILIAALAVTAHALLAGRPSTLAWGALAFAAALVAWAPRLWADPGALSLWLVALVVPALATAVASLFARRGRPVEGALALGLLVSAPLLVAERWWLLLALATLYLLARRADGLARTARFALAAAALLALAGGSFPWLREAPVSGALAALLAPPVIPLPLGRKAAVLTAKEPVFEVSGAAAGGEIRALTVDSYLTHSSALPCGTRLAEVEIASATASFRGDLVVGRDSAEWAAERADVARALACAPPPAFVRWIPSSGRFFGRTTRAVVRPPAPLAAGRIRIVRDAALPAELSLALFHLAAER